MNKNIHLNILFVFEKEITLFDISSMVDDLNNFFEAIYKEFLSCSDIYLKTIHRGYPDVWNKNTFAEIYYSELFDKYNSLAEYMAFKIDAFYASDYAGYKALARYFMLEYFMQKWAEDYDDAEKVFNLQKQIYDNEQNYRT